MITSTSHVVVNLVSLWYNSVYMFCIDEKNKKLKEPNWMSNQVYKKLLTRNDLIADVNL